MKKRFKMIAKWTLILGGIYVITSAAGDVSFETKIGWAVMGLGLGLAYVDGSLRDRIADLEERLDRYED